MKKITGVIIAKNEEAMIGDALKSISFCDEIIVIDNNSSDRTPEIAKNANAEVIKTESTDFSELRNLGLSKANGDYVLYIDADERVDEELKESIKEIVSNESQEYSAFVLFRKNYYFGKSEWPQIEKLERLFVKEKLKEWHGELHESPVFDGRLGKTKGFLVHYTHRDLESMLNKTIEWSSKEALLRYNAGHPEMSWWRFPRVMATSFLGSYIKQKGYKAGTAGLLESIYQSFSTFITYAKLWELQRKVKQKR